MTSPALDIILRSRRYLLRDTFSRPDSALAIGAPDTGPTFAAIAGTFGISSNKAYSVTDADGDIGAWDLKTADGTFEATVSGTLNSGTDFRLADLVVRVNASNEYIRIVVGAAAFNIQKNDLGSTTNLVTSVFTAVDGQDYRVSVKLSGNQVLVSRDGVLILSYVLTGGDTKYAAYTKHGFRLRKAGAPATAARWDNAVFTAP